MPVKRKDFLKPNAKTKSKAPVEPQSEDDFLEAADDHEQAAGKWRAGDAAKATRFFNRALEVYTKGLQRYPKSFDLAYNKANLEFNMIEDDRILAHLGNKVELLQETLRSHRAAVALNPEYTDVMFNTAQVLTSLAEAFVENGNYERRGEARELLQEAVGIFTKCLARQQEEYEQMQVALAEANSAQHEPNEREQLDHTKSRDTVPMEDASASSEGPAEWATIVEPVTPQTLLETCTAQLHAVTSLLNQYDPSEIPAIEPIAQIGLDTMNNKIPALITRMQEAPFPSMPEEAPRGPVLSIASGSAQEETTSPQDDALLTASSFSATIAELTYRSGQSSTTEYAQKIEENFAPLATTIGAGAQMSVLSAHADALIDFASAVSDRPQYMGTGPRSVEDIEMQWTALSKAQTFLTKLSAAPYNSTLSAAKLTDIYLARGDTDLFRFSLSLLDSAKPAWVKSKPILINNAGALYRGARTYAERGGGAAVREIADAKAVVAEILKEAASGAEVKGDRCKGKRETILRVMAQMVSEGILDETNAEGVAKYL